EEAAGEVAHDGLTDGAADSRDDEQNEELEQRHDHSFLSGTPVEQSTYRCSHLLRARISCVFLRSQGPPSHHVCSFCCSCSRACSRLLVRQRRTRSASRRASTRRAARRSLRRWRSRETRSPSSRQW